MAVVRYALLALVVLVLLAAAPAYEWRGSNGGEVPAIELRAKPQAGEKSSERSKASKERKADRVETKQGGGTGASSPGETPSGGGSGGASPAPAPAPAPAGGGDDDGGDD
jgi:hypothetical protein